MDIIGESKVCQDNTTTKVRLHNKNVFWLDIPMSYPLIMHVLYSQHNLSRYDTTLKVIEFAIVGVNIGE